MIIPTAPQTIEITAPTRKAMAVLIPS